MSDFNLVDPRGWDCDLHSVYSAYICHFQLHNIPWYERSYGVFFESFEEFLTFEWNVITVTDAFTGRPHIVTRTSHVSAFIKMIKTRFGETLPMVDNILRVTPFETAQRHLRKIKDSNSYKKVHSTLPAAVLAALKVRVRCSEPRAIRELWSSRDKTFLFVDFEWSERNSSSCLEWGYAAMQCNYLDATGVWPPDPESNFRRGHFIIAEYLGKVHNKHQPNFPLAYAFGDSQTIPKAKLPQVIHTIISSFASPDSETMANSLVLVGHGISGDLRRLEEMRIKIPLNVLTIDIATYEKQLFKSGQRGMLLDPSSRSRAQGSTLSLANMVGTLGVDVQCTMHNSGNDAFMGLLVFQLLLDRDNTRIPTPRTSKLQTGLAMGLKRSSPGVPFISFTPSPTESFPSFMRPSSSRSPSASPRTPDGYFEQDFYSSRRSPGHSPGNSPGRPSGSLKSRSTVRLHTPPQHGGGGEPRLRALSSGSQDLMAQNQAWVEHKREESRDR